MRSVRELQTPPHNFLSWSKKFFIHKPNWFTGQQKKGPPFRKILHKKTEEF